LFLPVVIDVIGVVTDNPTTLKNSVELVADPDVGCNLGLSETCIVSAMGRKFQVIGLALVIQNPITI